MQEQIWNDKADRLSQQKSKYGWRFYLYSLLIHLGQIHLPRDLMDDSRNDSLVSFESTYLWKIIKNAKYLAKIEENLLENST